MKTTVSIFHKEANELFDKLENALLRLEKEPSDRQSRDHTYHSTHAVKVLCSLANLEVETRIALEMSNVFDRLRLGQIDFAQVLVDTALTTRDILCNSVLSPLTVDKASLADLLENWQKLSASSANIGVGPADEKKQVSAADGKTRILIVDDEPINRMLLEETAKNCCDGDSGIISVATAQEAIYYYLTQNFHLVFLDIMMPEVDGNHFLAIVQKNRELGHLTAAPNIVVQTAVQSMDQLLSYVRLECVQEVIRKPISRERIEECIRRYCF